mgnify:CR=1 FL=1
MIVEPFEFEQDDEDERCGQRSSVSREPVIVIAVRAGRLVGDIGRNMPRALATVVRPLDRPHARQEIGTQGHGGTECGGSD